MRPLTTEDEAALRSIAERHGFYAARGPHTGEGSASRLIDALLAGEVVTLALTPADRRRLVAWLDEAPPPAGRLATVLHSLASQLRPTLSKAAPRAHAPAAVTTATTASPARHGRRGYLTTDEAARRLGLSPARVQELARAGEIGRKVDGRWAFTEREIARVQGERDRHALRLSLAPKRKRTTRRRRSSSGSGSGSGRLTRADTQALGYLDHLLAEERRLEQTYSLPFRAPSASRRRSTPARAADRTCSCSSSATRPATRRGYWPTSGSCTKRLSHAACLPMSWVHRRAMGRSTTRRRRSSRSGRRPARLNV